jgi:hypothetical protein
MMRRTSSVLATCLAAAFGCACGASEGSVSGVDSGPIESGNNPQDAPKGSGDDATLDQSATNADDGGADASGPAVDAPQPADAGLPPIDPSLMMAGLADAQLGEICDWMYTLLGGYGQVVHCPASVTITNEVDQAACIADHSYNVAGCPLTVGQFETCIEAEAPTQACDRPDPQCTPVFYCHLRPSDD